MITDKPVYKVVDSKSEIIKLDSLVRQSSKTDTCKYATHEGKIRLYKNKVQTDSISYSLDSNCPTFKFIINGEAVVYRMSYQCGMYLENFRQQENSKLFDKNRR